MCVQVPVATKTVRSYWAGVIGSCELPDENQTGFPEEQQALSLLRYLSSSYLSLEVGLSIAQTDLKFKVLLPQLSKC